MAGVRRCGGAAAVLGVVLIGAPAAVAVHGAQSPAAVERAVIAAARGQRSVHYVSHSSGNGSTVTQEADVARDRGIQRITFTANGRTGHVTVVVVNGVVYVRGDAFALQNDERFTASEAQSDAGAWVLIPQGSRLYRDTATDVTLPSAVADLRLVGHVAAANASAVTGTLVGVGVPATLSYVPGRPPLPVKEVIHVPGGSASVVMSRWNEAVDVTAPKAAKTLVPVATA